MFIWLKKENRLLWYILNGVGRYAYFVESAGAMAHWLFESSARQAVSVPMVEEAVTGLQIALDQYIVEDPVQRALR